MSARSDFWLTLHQLARCLESEGSTRGERSDSIASSLMSMPKAARIEMKKELSWVLDELTVLPPAITAKEVHKSDSGFFNFLKDLPKQP